MARRRRALAERRKAVGHTQERLAELLGIERSTVARWEMGLTEPLPGVRPALARALVVSLEELRQLLSGVSEGGAQRAEQLDHRALSDPASRELPTQEDELGLSSGSDIPATVAAVAELGRNDVHRRDFLRSAAFVAAASVAPSRDWLVATLDATHRPVRGRVAPEQVSAVRQAFATFQEADVMHGGGHARHALALYVTEQVLPMVREVDPASDAGSDLFAAASEQTYLLGWMAFDDGRHALAQRYLIQSLRLAQASGDVALGSHVLAGMSDQVRMLGHPREALRLAATGRHGLRQRSSPACMADLWALQARAHAALGEHTEAAHAIAQSEAVFLNVRREEEPEWARFIDTAYLAGEWANAFGEVNRPEESKKFARRSLDEAQRQRRARRGALSQAALARAALSPPRIDLEAALCNAHETLRLTTQVKSSRCVSAVEELRQRLRPFKVVPGVRDFNERARILLPAGA